GHAASAGAFILYSTHVAAMAPGTNVGAATPVQIGGLPGLPGRPGGEPTPAPEEEDAGPAEEAAPSGGQEAEGPREQSAPPPPSDALGAKSVNDAVAYIRSLAELRGRNIEWAEDAVRGASAITAQEALDLAVIEIVAEDLGDLLEQLDGRTVTIGGRERALDTGGLVVERLEPSLMTQILSVIANPNVAFILMLVGVYGLIFEFAQPGTIGPGIVGAISLVLALYALNQLPLNYAGLALVGLGIAFMAAEAITPSFGVLGLGGAVAFLIGAGMLFDTDVPEYRLSWAVIAVTTAASAGLFILVLGFLWRSFRRPVATGMERLVGDTAQVLDWADGAGHVLAEGERWSATGDAALAPGQTVRVKAADSLMLTVTADDAERNA
ncbi:MAG: nodulation protein NfeD, partial [Caulobacterales bacterium]|nr:nodulation protein NfeD [Caulobacterales bacterium]